MDSLFSCWTGGGGGPPINVAALMPPDSPQAEEVALLCKQLGDTVVNFIGAKESLEEFGEEELASVEVIASQKGNRQGFTDHLHKAPKVSRAARLATQHNAVRGGEHICTWRELRE